MTQADINQDPFLFDIEQLHAIATQPVIKQGLLHFQNNSVTELNCDAELLSAYVEDINSGVTESTELGFDGDGNLEVACSCDDSVICHHAIAVLYAYAKNSGEQPELRGAVDTAIKQRISRGRNEVAVKPSKSGAVFGVWNAQSIGGVNRLSRSYRVHIRSLTQRANFCSCPDFSGNQLGTCKHIEAVLHKISKKRNYSKIQQQSSLLPYILLDWDQPDAPQIALHRASRMSDNLAQLLGEYFDERGLFKGRLPDDFFRLAELLEGREDIDLGEDALNHVRRLADDLVHASRSEKIRQQIISSGGRLPGIQARLYPYQVEGVAFLAANGRALLADDMGLGKTLQAIAAASWLHQNARVDRILIVCPASLKHQWAREIKRFSGMDTQIIQGNAAARDVLYRRVARFTIINYELVLRDLSVINEVYSPDLMILDEAQRIKNWRTQIATAIKLIPSRYAFVLTGTPLENRLEDLYSLMQVVDARVLGPLWRYLVDFHITDENDKVLGYRNLSELRKRLDPVMLRRDRRLVAGQLPERIQQRIDLPLTIAQAELHDAAMHAAGTLAQLAKKRPLTPVEQNRLMAALQQARMACNAAGLVDKETEGSPKLDELEKLLDELCVQGGQKAVVFSQWALMTEMVERRLKKMGLGCVRLYGGVPTQKRGELMDRFRDDETIQVFISTDAGGVGLNLQNASVLINLDVPWNPAVLEQRIARIHRLGQKQKVQVMLLVTSEGYEGRVMELIQGKQHLFNQVIDQDASEDVVGVSPKLLEKLVDDLARSEVDKTSPHESVSDDAISQPDEASVQPSKTDPEAASDHAEDDTRTAITECVISLQQILGLRIERILGARGGLLVIIDRVDTEAEAFARELSVSSEIPVALIDPVSLNSLRRLGIISADEQQPVYFEAHDNEKERQPHPLMIFANERLLAAEALLQQSIVGPSVDLLLSALLAAAAVRAEMTRAVSVEQAGVWVYSEALAKGWLDERQAALIMRAVALRNSEAVPASLMDVLLLDCRGFIQSTEVDRGLVV